MVKTVRTASARRDASLSGAHRLVRRLYDLTQGQGPVWEEVMPGLRAISNRATVDNEMNAPRPRRSDEAWLRRQLETLNDSERRS